MTRVAMILSDIFGVTVVQMPAFETRSGIPTPYINLRHGRLLNDQHDQCTAGATTLTLEFGMLAILTGNSKYWEKVSSAFQPCPSMPLCLSYSALVHFVFPLSHLQISRPLISFPAEL